jgi:hypothetical protein
MAPEINPAWEEAGKHPHADIPQANAFTGLKAGPEPVSQQPSKWAIEAGAKIVGWANTKWSGPIIQSAIDSATKELRSETTTQAKIISDLQAEIAKLAWGKLKEKKPHELG